MSSIVKILRFLGVPALVLAIGFFALKPSPELGDLPLVPAALRRFLGQEDFLCNVGAFALLAVTVHVSLSGGRREPWARWLGRGAWMAGLVVALECAQIFLPQRHFDLLDILAGWCGLGLAGLPWLRLTRAVPPGRDGEQSAKR